MREKSVPTLGDLEPLVSTIIIEPTSRTSSKTRTNVATLFDALGRAQTLNHPPHGKMCAAGIPVASLVGANGKSVARIVVCANLGWGIVSLLDYGGDVSLRVADEAALRAFLNDP